MTSIKCAGMAALLFGLTAPAIAVPVQFVFSGTMASRHDPLGWLRGGFAPGQGFSVTVSFDTADEITGTSPGTLTSFRTSELSIVASSGGQVLSSYSNPTAACASIASAPGCGVLFMEAFSSSNPVGGDSLHYNQRGPLQIGEGHIPFPGAVTGGIQVSLADYSRTAFASGASLTSIPDITKFWSTFSFVVYSPIGNAGTPEQSVSGFGRITSVVATPVPEPASFVLWSAGLAALVSACRWRRRRE